MIIYLVGALFSQTERVFNRSLADEILKLVQDVEIILPQEFELSQTLSESEDRFQTLFDLCKESVNRADMLLAVLEGSDVDSGTCWEIGYAFALQKPVIGVRTDFKGLEEKGLNLMISRSVELIYDTRTEGTIAELAMKIVERIKKVTDKNKTKKEIPVQ